MTFEILVDVWGELTLLAPLPLVVLVNALECSLAAEFSRFVAVLIGVGTIALGIFYLSLGAAHTIPGGPKQLLGGAVLGVFGCAATSLAFRNVRARLAAAIPIDPDAPVHVVALALTIALVGLQLYTQVATDAVAAVGATGPVSRWDLLWNELPFLLAAGVGVGVFQKRSAGAALARLGLERPALRHVLLALALAGIFIELATGIDRLGQIFTPSTSGRVNATSHSLFSQLLDPGGIVLLAVVAGVCEEALFRGAMQPRLGILWTSIVFASVHTQYGLSLDALAVLIFSVGLGLLRRYVSTTASMMCHVAYDLVAAAGLAGFEVSGAIGIQVLLVALLAFTYWRRWRQHRSSPAPS